MVTIFKNISSPQHKLGTEGFTSPTFQSDMVKVEDGLPVKALDGTIEPLNGLLGLSPQRSTDNASLEQSLTRLKPSRKLSSRQLPPGQILTGRQEHCEWFQQSKSLPC